MNKTLVITTIALIAVVMGFSTIAPALQQAFAHDVAPPNIIPSNTKCPNDFVKDRDHPIRKHPDHNGNGVVCVKVICPGQPPGPGRCDRTTITITIDDIAVRR